MFLSDPVSHMLNEAIKRFCGLIISSEILILIDCKKAFKFKIGFLWASSLKNGNNQGILSCP
jgi:hypothetical protein